MANEGRHVNNGGGRSAPRQSAGTARNTGSYRQPSQPRRPARSHASGVPAGGKVLLAVMAVAVVVLGVILAVSVAREKRAIRAAATPSPSAVTEPGAVPAAALPTAEPEPQGPAAVLLNGLIVPGERGVTVPERADKVYDSRFDGAAFIGNSLVDGFRIWSGIANFDYICNEGMAVDNMIGVYLYNVTVREYDSVYLLLGINEIGWMTDTFINGYGKVLDYIREYQPTATIYVLSVTPTTKERETVPGEAGNTIALSTVLSFNEALRELCAEKNCWYLDVYSALADEEGYLPEAISFDGIHFEKGGYALVADYLRTHYVDDGLLEDAAAAAPADNAADEDELPPIDEASPGDLSDAQ